MLLRLRWVGSAFVPSAKRGRRRRVRISISTIVPANSDHMYVERQWPICTGWIRRCIGGSWFQSNFVTLGSYDLSDRARRDTFHGVEKRVWLEFVYAHCTLTSLRETISSVSLHRKCDRHTTCLAMQEPYWRWGKFRLFAWFEQRDDQFTCNR